MRIIKKIEQKTCKTYRKLWINQLSADPSEINMHPHWINQHPRHGGPHRRSDTTSQMHQISGSNQHQNQQQEAGSKFRLRPMPRAWLNRSQWRQLASFQQLAIWRVMYPYIRQRNQQSRNLFVQIRDRILDGQYLFSGIVRNLATELLQGKRGWTQTTMHQVCLWHSLPPQWSRENLHFLFFANFIL